MGVLMGIGGPPRLHSKFELVTPERNPGVTSNAF
eukprot:gene11595-10056_t